MSAGVVICRPRGLLRREYWRCPTCECRTETVIRHELWYGVKIMCCRCGDSWGDEGRFPRPFYRNWRRDAVRAHRRLWDVATYGPPPTFEELDAADGPPARRVVTTEPLS